MPIIFCTGFDESRYPQIFTEVGFDPDTRIVTLKKRNLALTLGELEREFTENKNKRKDDFENNSFDLLEIEQRYVIFSGNRDSLESVMKGFKNTYKPAARSVIYAMLTDTARTWTLANYLKELAEEHNEMHSSPGPYPIRIKEKSQ